jgi:hypothetical protein
MYKKQYDQKKIALRAVILVYNNYPDLDDETKRQMAESEEWLDIAKKSLIADDVAEKIYKQNKGILTARQSTIEADRIMNDVQPELLPNIEEWLDDQPISNIYIHGVSIPQIMNQFPNKEIDFLEALTCLRHWKDIDYQGKEFCRIYFMRM